MIIGPCGVLVWAVQCLLTQETLLQALLRVVLGPHLYAMTGSWSWHFDLQVLTTEYSVPIRYTLYEQYERGRLQVLRLFTLSSAEVKSLMGGREEKNPSSPLGERGQGPFVLWRMRELTLSCWTGRGNCFNPTSGQVMSHLTQLPTRY